MCVFLLLQHRLIYSYSQLRWVPGVGQVLRQDGCQDHRKAKAETCFILEWQVRVESVFRQKWNKKDIRMCSPTVSCICQNLERRRCCFNLCHILIGWLDWAFYRCHGDETVPYLLRRRKNRLLKWMALRSDWRCTLLWWPSWSLWKSNGITVGVLVFWCWI